MVVQYNRKDFENMVEELTTMESKLKSSKVNLMFSLSPLNLFWNGAAANMFDSETRKFLTEGDYQLFYKQVEGLRGTLEASIDDISEFQRRAEWLGISIGVNPFSGRNNEVMIDTSELYTFTSNVSSVKTDNDNLKQALFNIMNASSLVSWGLYGLKIRGAHSKVDSLNDYKDNLVEYKKDVVSHDDDLKQQYIKWQNYKVGDKRGDNPSNSANELEMDTVILLYEEDNPEMADRIEKFLESGGDDLTEDDVRRIKYLIYTADEPYRTIFLENIDDFSVATYNTPDGSYQSGGYIYLTYPNDFADDPRGAYTVFFHESGHAIDDLAKGDFLWWTNYGTENYSSYVEEVGRNMTIREAIYYDIYVNENNPHSVASVTKDLMNNSTIYDGADAEAVEVAILTGNTKHLDDVSLLLYTDVVAEITSYPSGVQSAQMESVSDVYGGASNNTLRNNYGHDKDYWDDKSKLEKELWAEYFSYNMAGDETNLEMLREYFPTASLILDDFAEELGEQYD